MDFYQGRLNTGEPISTPVIKALKKKIVKDKNVILDSPLELPVLMKILHNEDIAKLYSKGQPLVLEMPGWRDKFVHLHELIQNQQRN